MSSWKGKSSEIFVISYSYDEQLLLTVWLLIKNSKFDGQCIALRIERHLSWVANGIGWKILAVRTFLCPHWQHDRNICFAFLSTNRNSEFNELIDLNWTHVEESEVVWSKFYDLRVLANGICFNVAVGDKSWLANAVVGGRTTLGTVGTGFYEGASLVYGCEKIQV